MTHQIHHVPGRLRVRVPAIRRNSRKAAPVIALLRDLRGVSTAEPNLMTGSIVIRYDPESTSADAILSVLTAGGHFRAHSPAPARSPAVQIQNKLANALLWYCLEKVVERSIPLLIAAIL